MTTAREEIQARLVRLLAQTVPELEPDDLKADVRLRDQLDIDSMDFLNFVIAMSQEFGVDIPETDYPQLETLQSCTKYVVSKHARP
jgi:acyl carrier protein